ncbi:MAG: histidine kinase, partial [bacterium]|nr:histidine kinase [bacterium]
MIGLKQVYLKLEHVLCLLVLLMLPICMPGEGDETLKFQHLSIEDGLSQSTINTFLQDRKGFMWFGTQDGLNRYDGVNFVIHKYSPDSTDVLSDNYINALCEDSNGKLWIGTNNGGLNCFDPSGECFTQYRHRENGEHSNEVKNKGTISNDRIKALFEDRWGYLWIGTTSGLDCFDRRLKTFTNFKNMPGDPNSLSHNDVRCIAEDPHGNLWIGTWGGGLNRYNYASGTFTRFTTPPKNGNRGTNKG